MVDNKLIQQELNIEYDSSCMKLKRVIESVADRVIYEKGIKEKNFANLLRLNKNINIKQQILLKGVERFEKILRRTESYYNGHNLTLVWVKTPRIEKIFNDLFLVVNFFFYSFDDFTDFEDGE